MLTTDTTQCQPRSPTFRAENADIPPKAGKRSFDAQFAEAFRGLEEQVCDLACAADIFEIVMDTALKGQPTENGCISIDVSGRE